MHAHQRRRDFDVLIADQEVDFKQAVGVGEREFLYSSEAGQIMNLQPAHIRHGIRGYWCAFQMTLFREACLGSADDDMLYVLACYWC